jgi:hypothetical protein
MLELAESGVETLTADRPASLGIVDYNVKMQLCFIALDNQKRVNSQRCVDFE